ncbi:hypothetical protein CRUP_005612, partial [Coryphaenoides rupestris]
IPRPPHPSDISPYYPLSPGAVGQIPHPLGFPPPLVPPTTVLHANGHPPPRHRHAQRQAGVLPQRHQLPQQLGNNVRRQERRRKKKKQPAHKTRSR